MNLTQLQQNELDKRLNATYKVKNDTLTWAEVNAVRIQYYADLQKQATIKPSKLEVEVEVKQPSEAQL